MEQSKEELYNLLKKEVKKANARISRIEKAFGKDSWGVKRIRPYLETEKLNAITEKGFIAVRKSMTETQMKMLEKYLNKECKGQNWTIVRPVISFSKFSCFSSGTIKIISTWSV